MEQRTCNIIFCCKGHCPTGSEQGMAPMDAIAAYMSRECACPVETYNASLMESILKEAMFDFISTTDKPDADLRNLFHTYLIYQPSLSERIINMFSLTHVRDKNGQYANGFTEQLVRQSERDLDLASELKPGAASERSGGADA